MNLYLILGGIILIRGVVLIDDVVLERVGCSNLLGRILFTLYAPFFTLQRDAVCWEVKETFTIPPEDVFYTW